MRRANPRQIGNVCHRCAFAPARAVANQAFISSTLLSSARHVRNSTLKPLGVRWIATSP
ncbi:hypothetical protein BHE90_017780, partial [Fusarium euwallaceae]